MKKKINIILATGILLGAMMMGCTSDSSAVDSTEGSNEGLVESENLEQSYTVNEDGTFTCEGIVYNYKLTLTGKEEGADETSKYVVLTNNKNLSFDNVFRSLISSKLETGEPEFVLLGSYID